MEKIRFGIVGAGNQGTLYSEKIFGAGKVENGVVTAVKKGTATITVKTANGKKDTVKIKVVEAIAPSSVELEEG